MKKTLSFIFAFSLLCYSANISLAQCVTAKPSIPVLDANNNIHISWSDGGGSFNQIRFRKKTALEWIYLNTGATSSAILTSLDTNKMYLFQVLACSDTSAWSPLDSFQVITKPNIIVIMLDDARYNSYSCNGAPAWFQSPGIDRIANEGVNFKNNFVVYSSCGPSRATFYTGLYPHLNGAYDNNYNYNPDLPTTGSILNAGGYYTAMMGKYLKEELDNNPKQGWDFWMAKTPGGFNYNGSQIQIAGYQLEFLADTFYSVLERNINRNPLFMVLAYTYPHEPYDPLPQDIGIYANEEIPFPKNFVSPAVPVPDFYTSLASEYQDSSICKADVEAYFEELTGVDRKIQEIIDTLSVYAPLDNYMIIFTSDNGKLLGEHQLNGKVWPYNESMRVPLFIRYPKWFPAGSQVTNESSLNIDLATTILDAAGIENTYNMQGLSLRNLYSGNQHRNEFYFEGIQVLFDQPDFRTVRSAQFSYTKYQCESIVEQFFDLVNDPLELTNQIHNAAYQTQIESYRSKLDSFAILLSDTVALIPGVCSEITCDGITYYPDADDDGFGSSTVFSCVQQSGYITDNTDCNDFNASIYPGSNETCSNGIDDDCNGFVDEYCDQPKVLDADLGAGADDFLFAAHQTIDGGYILGGCSNSGIGGDKSEPSQGLTDFWVVKTDSNRMKLWDKRYGGIKTDCLYSLDLTSDKGFILAGKSNSGSSGDKSQGVRGDFDYWIVKTDSNGAKQWDKRFGSTSVDRASSIHQTSDGGYIIGGYSLSGLSGDKSQASKGGYDYWIVKTDANGIKQWDKSFGGSGDDFANDLKITSDGGFIIGGESQSGISGDKSQASQGGHDYWIVKTNANGVKQWDKSFGGSADDYLISLQQTSDGGYLLGGYSNSGITGDKSQASQGGIDFWILKTDSFGIKQWDQRFGGSKDDYLISLQKDIGGGYILGGYSSSDFSGNKTQPSHGGNDYWIIKTDAFGLNQSDLNYGGNDDDILRNVLQTGDGQYLLAGYSNSPVSGDKTMPSQGGYDFWILKTLPCEQQTFYVDADTDTYGNMAVTSISCTAPFGYVSNNSDCNDANASVHPNATEVCNSIDDDCDVLIDEGVQVTFYLDADADGYGNVSTSLLSCTTPSGYVINSTDCNDANSAIHPGASDVCNNIDDNCDNAIDENAISATITPSGTTTICDGSSIILSANTGAGITYQWIKGSKDLSGATNQTYSAKKAADYKVSETNTFGCASTSSVVTITILTSPAATITPIGNLDICITGSVTLQANFAVGFTYQWKKGANILAGETNQTYTATKAATYKVIVTNSNNCSKTSGGTKVTKSCKQELFSKLTSLEIHPNPNNGIVTIEITVAQEQTISISITNVLGREVFSSEEGNISGTFTKRIDLSKLPSGTYFLNVMHDGESEMRKILIEK